MDQVIDFTKNFVDVCHHGKEQESLFPAPGTAGCRGEKVGPIARMFLEHQVTKEMAVAAKMEQPEKISPVRQH